MSQITASLPASTALAAIHDVFTYLCDCALRRAPRAWRWWNIPDRYRLRTLRQLARAAGLVDSATLRPTALTADWLARPPAEQLAILAEAWADQAETPVRRMCLGQVLAAAPGSRLSMIELTGRQSPERQQALWFPLAWLGYLHPESDSDNTLWLIRAALPDAPSAASTVTITNTAIEVNPPYSWPDLWELEHVAELQDPGPPRRYALTRAHWQRAWTLGYSPSVAFSLLERLSGQPVPRAAWEFFSPPQPDVTAHPGVLLTFTQAEELSKLCRRRTWHQRLIHRLSPHHVWVSPAQAPVLLRALRRHGLSLQSDPALTAPAKTRASDADTLQFLLAAHVMQALAQELDLPAPLDQATLAAWLRRLPPSHQRRLEQSLQRQMERIRQHLPEPRAALPNASLQTHHPRPLPDIEQTILVALEQGYALQLHYQPPPPRPLITRPVVPLQLEPWGPHTYLLAWCLSRNDVRTFRLDRIMEATLLEK